LRLDGYRTSAKLRIYALLPAEMEKDGIGQERRDFFVGAGRWEKEEVEGCRLILWKAVLHPSE